MKGDKDLTSESFLYKSQPVLVLAHSLVKCYDFHSPPTLTRSILCLLIQCAACNDFVLIPGYTYTLTLSSNPMLFPDIPGGALLPSSVHVDFPV